MKTTYMHRKTGAAEAIFINGKELNGAGGKLFCRPLKENAENAPAGTVAVGKLTFRLSAPENYYEELHRMFSAKQVFVFEIHHHMNPVMAAPAVISALEKTPGIGVVCLVEFNLA